VVYSGVGLGGYDSLLILRHSSGYLSAYSLNCALLRKEGDVLRAGDVIASIDGSGRAGRFHFEIRKDGEPVSPRTLLK
jgi:lipoprotein NlpD